MGKLSLKQKQAKLEEIAGQIEKCKVCKKDKIGLPVPGEGNADADVVFIGEAPGKKEAETGRPFIGRAGKVLRTLIKEAGLLDSEVFITSPVKYLPKYVTPTTADIDHGRRHLNNQFSIIEPKVVVLLGRVAAEAVLKTGKAQNFFIAKEHGKVIEQDGITYLITYHPAAMLYSPKLKAELMKDFKKLKILLRNK